MKTIRQAHDAATDNKPIDLHAQTVHERNNYLLRALAAESQRDELQTELGNTQFALEEMVAQRDATLAALRAVLAVLTQPVQFGEPRSSAVAILRGDCEAARQIIKAAIAAAGQ